MRFMSTLGTSGISKPDLCEFCDEFSGGRRNAFHEQYQGLLTNRILCSTEDFRIFPTIGQLVEGYILIAPVMHYTALDEMPVKLLRELRRLHSLAKEILSRTYGACVSFEHGARSPVNGGCGIYHAHLHIVPLGSLQVDLKAMESDLRSRFPYYRVRDLVDLKTIPPRPYLFYEGINGDAFRFAIDRLPSQHMRKVLASHLGVENWDWRVAGTEQRLFATLRNLRNHFVNTKESPQLDSKMYAAAS